MAVTASFISANAMIVFVIPILVAVYNKTHPGKKAGKDKSLAVVLILATCFAANAGGPGSPSAGGRNALMVGILQDYGQAPSFGEWVMYGLPFVPVMTLVIAGYFFLRFRKTVLGERVNIAAMVREESEKIGAMTRKEYITAGILVSVILLWIMGSKTLGMGGPVLFGLVALAVFRIIGWREINTINWDVVALYAGACAMGTGLADTGAAVWLANGFVAILPEFMQSGEGLAIAVSFFTGSLTNIMSDGATVSAVGPLVVPMANLSGTPPWMVGLSCAFSSSFANCLIIGTPANAIAYAFARDSETGEQLVSLGDFFKHGLLITGLMFLVLWIWTFYGYWRILGF
jgi:sodium-dependent dicarboxylate transporter 2/3/5